MCLNYSMSSPRSTAENLLHLPSTEDTFCPNPRLLASHYMVAIAYHVTLKGSAVGSASFDSVLAARRGARFPSGAARRTGRSVKKRPPCTDLGP